jgi:hypothetical protein
MVQQGFDCLSFGVPGSVFLLSSMFSCSQAGTTVAKYQQSWSLAKMPVIPASQALVFEMLFTCTISQVVEEAKKRQSWNRRSVI